MFKAIVKFFSDLFFPTRQNPNDRAFPNTGDTRTIREVDEYIKRRNLNLN